MAIAFCPDCEESLSLGPRPKVGQRIVCSSCGAELEVVEVSPLELDWVYDEPEEDWEEDDDEDEDDWDDDEEDDWDDDEEDDWDEDEDEEDWDED